MILESLNDLLNLLPAVRHSPKGRLQASYDEEADVQNIHFDRSIPVTDIEITDDDIIVWYNGDDLVGITILQASRR